MPRLNGLGTRYLWHMREYLLVAGVFMILYAVPAFAYRPFITEDAGVAGKGVLQTETSYDFFKWKNGDTDQIFLLVSPIYGPTENLELSIETPYIIHRPKGGSTSEGVGDINLVAKYVLLWENYEKKDAFFTMKGVVKLDTGNFEKGLGRGDVEYSITPVITKTIGENLTAHGQLGYTLVTNSKDNGLRNFFFYGAALDWAMTKPFHFVTEFDGNKHPNPTLGYQNISLFGFTYEISKHLTIDVSYKKGLSNAAPSWGFGFGAAIEF